MFFDQQQHKKNEMNTTTPTPTPTQITEAHRITVRAMRSVGDETWALPYEKAAQFIADSEARAVAEVVNALTCTHHNDAMRAACPVCLVATLRAERDQLRAEAERLRAGIGECLRQNGHLADGDNCTLIGLKRCLRAIDAAMKEDAK